MLFITVNYCLDSNNIYTKLNHLAFKQCFETWISNFAKMGKNIWTWFLLDKTETFSFVEPFYSTFNNILVWHNKSYWFFNNCESFDWLFITLKIINFET